MTVQQVNGLRESINVPSDRKPGNVKVKEITFDALN